MIDETSLERYGNEKSEFGTRLRNSIDWDEECFYQNNRRCAFLNEENLCDLYKALGPDSLCDTCRMYPRHTEEYEGLRELSLSLSCPEAARIILSCKEPVRFLKEEDDLEDDFEEFDFMMFSQLEDTRDVLFSILQDRSLPLTLRMSASEQLTEQYQIRVEEQKEYEIDELLRNCEAHHQRKKLQEFVSESLAEKGIDAASLHRWTRQIEELKVLRGLELLRPEWDGIDAKELFRQIKERYLDMKIQLFGKTGNTYMPEQISLLEGFILLAALDDEMLVRGNSSVIDKLKRIRAMVYLRNNSIFAHGLGPVSQTDYLKFKSFVLELFREFCDIEQINFAQYNSKMTWITPFDSVYYSGLEGN